MASALDGTTVLDLGKTPAAALASQFLSDHGARVLRVVGPDEAALRDGGFRIWDRGKAWTRIDLAAALPDVIANAGTTNHSAARLARLIAAADVLIDDFAPASPLQGLVTRETLERLNPRLVHCSITAYGKHGPYRDEPPIDDLVLARMGVLGGMPGFRPPPVHVVHPLPSVGAALLACNGIAASLLARETTGRGRSVETSLMAGALLYHPKVVGERIKRHVFQTHPSGSAPFYSLYRCADGRWVQLGCVHAAFIAVAAKLMGLDKLIEEPRFDKGRAGATPADDAELRAAVARVIETKPFQQWAAELEAADVPFAEARQTQDSLDDAQIAHNGMLITLDDPAVGSLAQMGVPVALSATPGRVQGPRPSAETDGDLGAPRATGVSAGGNEQAPPLDGVRILEITNLIAGPTAGRILADLGADVIKLEPPEGDMSRPIGRTYFYSVNFNKRSIAIDMRKPDAKRIVQAIAAKADALVANLRPKATERMGIGPAINPRLIETHLTGYGWTGPYSHRPGIDPLAQALMGLSRAQGGKENPPVFPAQLAPTDYTTGAMGAFGTILALLERKRKGTVQRVDVNLLSGGIVLASEWFTRYRGRPERPLADKEQMGLTPYHRLFHVADGWIYVTAETPAQQQALCAVAGLDPSAFAAGEGGMHPNETPLARALSEALAGRTCAVLLAAFAAHGIPAAPAMAGDSEIFLDDPHSHANGMVAERAHPTAGKIRVAWNYVSLPGTRATAGRHTPLLGEHSHEVLREVGFAEPEVAQFAADGTIVTER